MTTTDKLATLRELVSIAREVCEIFAGLFEIASSADTVLYTMDIQPGDLVWIVDYQESVTLLHGKMTTSCELKMVLFQRVDQQDDRAIVVFDPCGASGASYSLPAIRLFSRENERQQSRLSKFIRRVKGRFFLLRDVYRIMNSDRPMKTLLHNI